MSMLDSIADLPASSEIAWVFPGQGAQAVGMGRDLYESCAAARRIFDAADGALDRPLSRICFEGPEDELTRTANTQPALVTHAIAALAAALEAGVLDYRPAFVAGHSLGEYAALVAAGSVSFEDGVRLVAERGRLMQEACDAEPSTMAAVLGLDPETLAAVCEPHATTICNINAPGNITIGGVALAVEAACEAATAAGASRTVPLTVAGAFHTPLMQSAADGMRTVLESAAFSDPAIPVISNVTAQPIAEAGAIPGELSIQIIRPVLWLHSIATMQAAGVTQLIEFGPGRVLSGLARRIDRRLATRNIGTVEEVHA